MDAFSWTVNASTDVKHAAQRLASVGPDAMPKALVTDSIVQKVSIRPSPLVRERTKRALVVYLFDTPLLPSVHVEMSFALATPSPHCG
jgi:hypothetical protein